MNRLAHSFSLLAALASPAFGQSVLTVNPNGGGNFLTIQAAVDAASPGDHVLLATARYQAGATITKPLTLAPLPGAGATIDDPLIVRNLGAGETVLIHGFSLLGSGLASALITIENCRGPVWVQSCSVRPMPSILRPTAIRVAQSDAVFFANLDVSGSDLPFSTGSGPGGIALDARASTIAAFDCSFDGGVGGVGQNGGAAMMIASSTVDLQRCSITGGGGGPITSRVGFPCAPSAGSGGDGLSLDGSSEVRHLASTFAGGRAGLSNLFPCVGAPGVAGLATRLAPGAVFNNLSAAPSTLYLERNPTVPSQPPVYGVVRELEQRAIEIEGRPGDAVLLGIDFVPNPVFFPFIRAPLLLGGLFESIPIGFIPGSGRLSIPVRTPDVLAPLQAQNWFFQVYTISPIDGATGGSGFAMVLVDSSV